MSKIVVLLRSAEPKAMMLLRAATGAAWADISDSAKRGRAMAEFRLFRNDHEEVSQRLRRFMSQLREHGMPAEFFELSPDEALEAVGDLEACRMKADVVENTLRRHEEGLMRLKLGDPQPP